MKSPALPNRQKRDARGRWTAIEPGESADSETTGLTTVADRHNELPAQYAFLRRELTAFLRGCESDEGGSLTEVPTRRRANLEYRGRLHRRILQLDAALELRGLTDKRGKLRTHWLSQLVTLINAARQLDALLGLDRRQRNVLDLDPATYLERLSPTPSPLDPAARAPAEIDHAGAPEVENADG